MRTIRKRSNVEMLERDVEKERWRERIPTDGFHRTSLLKGKVRIRHVCLCVTLRTLRSKGHGTSLNFFENREKLKTKFCSVYHPRILTAAKSHGRHRRRIAALESENITCIGIEVLVLVREMVES